MIYETGSKLNWGMLLHPSHVRTVFTLHRQL